MVARKIALAAAAVLLTLSLAPQPAAARIRSEHTDVPFKVLTGTLTRKDYEHYREVPFDLPPGVTRLSIRFTYGGKEAHSVIDIGLSDPRRFRGWSGGTRDYITVSAEDASPGYLAGPLPAGHWHLILGAPNIRKGATAPFEAKIYVERQASVTEFADDPINSKAGWYRGDLHMHSGNSDGKCRAQTGAKVPCPVYRTVEAAAARGLDFIALTDHNTTAHYNELRELQPAFDKILVVPGREITTFFGHANEFGLTNFVDFRMTEPTYADGAKWIEAINRAGGLVSINHPGAPTGEACMGCGWRIENLKWGSIAAVEVVNGGTTAGTGSAESAMQGFAFWQKLLDKGEHVTAIGGSDNHDPGIPAGLPNAVGMPTTVIYMPELSVRGLIDGIRSGRVFIDVDGSADRLLDMSARGDGDRVEMGGTLKSTDSPISVDTHVMGAARGRIELIIDGSTDPRYVKTLESNDQHISFDVTLDPGPHTLRADVRNTDGDLILVGNPIYIRR